MPYRKKESFLTNVRKRRNRKKYLKKNNLYNRMDMEISEEISPSEQTAVATGIISDDIEYVRKPANSNRKGNDKKSKGFLIVCLCLTFMFLVASGVFLYDAYGRLQQTIFKRETESLASLSRVIVPNGFFAEKAVEYTNIKGMKGIEVTPGIDFYTDINMDEDSLKAEIAKIIKNMGILEFNTVIINTNFEDSVIYKSSSLKSTPLDALGTFIEMLDKQNISVLTKFNLSDVSTTDGTLIQNNVLMGKYKQNLYDAAAELTNYKISGILLNNYYVKRDSVAYKSYMEYSPMNISLDEYIYNNTITTISNIKKAVNNSANSIPTGLYISDIWATDKENESGVNVAADFSALTDGNVDTKKIVQDKILDFACVNIKNSLYDSKVPFGKVASWWDSICKDAGGFPLYIVHKGENANSNEIEGWNGTDQLARQLNATQKLENYSGNAFTGISSLMQNFETSTDILLKTYSKEYNEGDLLQDLTISLPAKTSFITYDESVQFRGKFDPNQEVLLNGEKVVPSERGGFSVWVPLNVGKNQIVLEHKGQKKYYNIERKVIIFKEWSPTENIKVAGSSQLELTALAYKNSKITATINGQTITLQEGGGGDQHLGDTSYVYYTGFFNVPKATAKEQNIGKIKFSGSYQGYGEQKDGANIIIDKLPDEVDPDELSGKVLRHITVNNPYANMYDYKTTPEFGSSVIYQLPQGSQDIVLSENTVHFKNSGKTHTYYNLRSGKTVRKDDVSVSNIPFVGNNRISKFTAGVEGNDTVIRLTMDWKAPISVNLNPYPKTVNEAGKKYVFSSSQVEILLDYSTTVAKDNTFIDLSNSRVFSGITHERVRNEALNIWQYKITLPLSSGSRYYGCHATYEGNDLVIKFNHGPTGGGSLSGVNIVVDPGHGGNDTGTMAGRDVLEKTVNLSLAEKIKYELEALGANVYMTRTGDVNPSVADRSNYAYQIQADLFISVHHNSAGSDSKPNGIETYYNTPFSQPLAQAVHSQITRYSLGDRGVRTGIDRNFFVNRNKQFPSLLIEFGYLSSPNDEAIIQDDNHQWNMAKGVAQGVLNYYN